MVSRSDGSGDERQRRCCVVLAHMHYVDPLVSILLHAIRLAVGASVPVQFLTGHSHIRAWKRLDARAATLEAGHYGDTLGFASFDVPGRGDAAPTEATKFGYDYLPMRRQNLINAVGMAANSSAFDTPDGVALSRRIRDVRAQYGLSAVLGCAAHYYNRVALWGLYMKTVAPAHLFSPAHNASQWFVTSTGALRYDLYAGNVTADDIDMALPFADTLFVVQNVDGTALTTALQLLLNGSVVPAGGDRCGSQASAATADDALGGTGMRPLAAAASTGLPNYVATASALKPGANYDAIVGRFDKACVAAAIQMAMGAAAPAELVPYDEHAVAPGGTVPPPADDTHA